MAERRTYALLVGAADELTTTPVTRCAPSSDSRLEGTTTHVLFSSNDHTGDNAAAVPASRGAPGAARGAERLPMVSGAQPARRQWCRRGVGCVCDLGMEGGLVVGWAG